MVIENRNLSPGTRLVATYRKAHHACIVSAGEDGKTVFTLEDGKSFKSPSAAASAIMAGMAANGWRWWSVEGEAPAAVPATTKKPAKAPKPAKAKTSGGKTIRRTPNQKGVPEGGVRWFCDSCMSGFVATGDDTDPACPQGHRNPQAETGPTP